MLTHLTVVNTVCEVSVLAALIVLPALLAVLGHRVNALRIRRSVPPPEAARSAEPPDESSGAWYRLARSVMRRPVVYVTVITIALLALSPRSPRPASRSSS